MVRLIDADALKEPLELQRASYVRIGAIERAEAYANCLWEIAHAPTVGGWVSVEDRLPEKNGDYLTYDTDDIVWPHFFRAGLGLWDDSIGYRKDNVTHWMPLPEPPGGERDGD